MFPKKGKELPGLREIVSNGAFEQAIAEALNAELGPTHRAIKTVMRWTGASDRTVKHWFAGTHGPSGPHLIALARHSDAVVMYFLLAADRPSLSIGIGLSKMRAQLLQLAETIDLGI